MIIWEKQPQRSQLDKREKFKFHLMITHKIHRQSQSMGRHFSFIFHFLPLWKRSAGKGVEMFQFHFSFPFLLLLLLLLVEMLQYHFSFPFTFIFTLFLNVIYVYLSCTFNFFSLQKSRAWNGVAGETFWFERNNLGSRTFWFC